MKLSDYVIRFIAAQGVQHVFLLPGGGAMHLNDSLGQCGDLEFVCNLHEQASAVAAEAYAQVTNNLGVAMVTTGPGGTNAITGVAAAWLDSAPCLFVSGQVKRADMKGSLGVRQLGSQEIDIVSLVKPITKYAVTVTEPDTIRFHLEQALYLAKSGRQGPVWIDIPLDVQAVQIEPAALAGFTPPAAEIRVGEPPLAEQVRRVLDLLNDSQRPVILAGNGVHLAGARAEFLELVELLGVPVLTTWLGLDVLPQAHPLLAGRPGGMAPRGANFTLQNADFLLILGSRLDMGTTGYSHERFARGARKAMVDLDPAEIQKMRMRIDVPVVADLRDFLRELLRQRAALRPQPRAAWNARCQEWKVKYPVVLPEHWQQTEAVSTYCLADVLSDELTGEDLIVPGSSGNAVEIFFLVFRAKAGQRVLHQRGLGAMGFGLPASIGACLASGRRRTICLDGDGGFQLNLQEFETVARLQLPLKMFVVSNQGFASIRASQQNYFQRLMAADATSGLTLPDLVQIAAAYRLPAVRIDRQEQLRDQVRAVLEMPGPTFCEIVAPADEVRAPRLASAQRPDGSMVSRPLEDLWPFLDRDEFRSNMLIPVLED